ncbi:MFS transporter [Parvularcula oceani]|uniref:MFS transporter n=1 Tax=Parvularcula oceani TaxID=1247963 RepID=UPI0004E0FEE0|nr:MFS transporter [Parvularcula oceani]
MLTFLRDNARWLAGGFLLTMFSSFGQTFFIGLSNTDIRTAFSLSDGEFGALYGLATIASALTLPFLGRVLDVAPGWRVALFVMPGLAAACLLLAFAPSVLILLIALYLLRLLGQGMMSHIALVETGRWFAARRGKAMSIVVLGYQGGEAILPALSVALAAWFGFRGIWIGSAVLLALALPLIVGLLRKDRAPKGEAEAPVSDVRDWTQKEVLRDPLFYLLLTGVLAPPFIGTTIFFYLDTLAHLRGFDEAIFAAAFPVKALLTVIFALICGQLVDRFGAVRVLPFFLLPLAAACITVAVSASPAGVFAFMALLGVSYGLSATLFGALWPEVYGTGYLGGVRSLVSSGMVVATAIGPALVGPLLDRGVPYETQLYAMAVWCAGACIVLVITTRLVLARLARSGAELREASPAE